MSGQLAVVPTWDDGPVHRSIVAIDVEGSTKRTNPVKGEMRRVLYDLLEQALKAAGIGPRHLEELADRGDGVLILIRPHDDVPKTVLFGRLVPALTALLAEHNAAVGEPELQMRLRVVVHAGEVHDDGRGFYGDDIDVAFRLLNSPAVKRALRQASVAPLVLVTSEEMWHGIVRHGYVKGGPYEQRVQVRVGDRRRRGRVHIPVPARSDLPGRIARDPRTRTARSGPSLAIASHGEPAERATVGYAALNGHAGH
jgi:class 3 adenylate cyclase